MSRADPSLAVSAALLAALAFGLASALQHAESRREHVESRGDGAAPRSAVSPALLRTLSQRPVWLLGLAADVAAVVLQAVALHAGAVALVQPLLVAGLPFAVLLSCALARRWPGRAELVGVLLCSAGLGLLLPVLTSTGVGRPPGRLSAAVAGVVLGTVVTTLLVLARRRPGSAGITLGAAAGTTVGTGSVLLAVCAARTGHLVHLLFSIAPYSTVAVGLLGLALSQAAFQTGTLGAPLATLSIVEPVVAVVLAVTVLHEHVRVSGPAAGVVAVGVVLSVLGVLRLSDPAVAPVAPDPSL